MYNPDILVPIFSPLSLSLRLFSLSTQALPLSFPLLLCLPFHGYFTDAPSHVVSELIRELSPIILPLYFNLV